MIPRPPIALYRNDGERFTRNADNTYTMDSSMMARPYRYTYERLMETGVFTQHKPRVDLVEEQERGNAHEDSP